MAHSVLIAEAGDHLSWNELQGYEVVMKHKLTDIK